MGKSGWSSLCYDLNLPVELSVMEERDFSIIWFSSILIIYAPSLILFSASVCWIFSTPIKYGIGAFLKSENINNTDSLWVLGVDMEHKSVQTWKGTQDSWSLHPLTLTCFYQSKSLSSILNVILREIIHWSLEEFS